MTIIQKDIGVRAMKHLLIFLGLLVAFPLGGCVSQQEILNEYKEKCRSFGFADGSTQFSECMEKQDLEQQRDSAILFSSPGWGPGWGY
jgi:hypothetical protein